MTSEVGWNLLLLRGVQCVTSLIFLRKSVHNSHAGSILLQVIVLEAGNSPETDCFKLEDMSCSYCWSFLLKHNIKHYTYITLYIYIYIYIKHYIIHVALLYTVACTALLRELKAPDKVGTCVTSWRHSTACITLRHKPQLPVPTAIFLLLSSCKGIDISWVLSLA